MHSFCFWLSFFITKETIHLFIEYLLDILYSIWLMFWPVLISQKFQFSVKFLVLASRSGQVWSLCFSRFFSDDTFVNEFNMYCMSLWTTLQFSSDQQFYSQESVKSDCNHSLTEAFVPYFFFFFLFYGLVIYMTESYFIHWLHELASVQIFLYNKLVGRWVHMYILLSI